MNQHIVLRDSSKADGVQADFNQIWPAIDRVKGYLVPGQEMWLYNMVHGLPDDAVIVEIGSYMGRSTTAMAFACRGTKRQIYAIDTFAGNDSDFVKGVNNVDWQGGDYFELFKTNLADNNLLDYVTPIQSYSYEAGESWDQAIDFLFVDGSHEFEDVVSDFELFFPFVRPGGVVAFHYVLPEWDGPSRAWHEVIRHQVYRPSHFFSIAYGTKPHDIYDFKGKIHVVLPVHNRCNFTINSLRSLMSQTVNEKIEIYVVDDGSTDATREKVTQEFPSVTLLTGDGNLWWTGAVAFAIDRIKPKMGSEDYVLLVNNDSTLSAETVEILVRESIRLKRSAVAPVALSGGQAISTGWGVGTASILNHFSRQFQIMKEQENTLPTKSIFGRCSLYPAEIFDVLGNFDALAFPHYHGDTDFALRAHGRGFKFYVTGCTTIRVREDDATTGSHHEFRKGPQNWAAVVENMTSLKSIDNVKANWRYFARHNSSQLFSSMAHSLWRSLKYWQPIYRLAEQARPFTPVLRWVIQLPRVVLSILG
ncbi:MAG: class I SAM-dependent methyltransferase, partial [Pseudomonadota bacterium]